MASQPPISAANAATKSPESLTTLLDSLDDGTWLGWLRKQLGSLLVYAASNPANFVLYAVLILSPLLLLSAAAAYKLHKEIQQRDKEQKRRQRRDANIKRSRSKKDS